MGTLWPSMQKHVIVSSSQKKLMTPGLSPCLFSCSELHVLALVPSPRSVSLIWPRSDFIFPSCHPSEQWTCSLILSAPRAEQPSSPSVHLSHPGALPVLTMPSHCISDTTLLSSSRILTHRETCVCLSLINVTSSLHRSPPPETLNFWQKCSESRTVLCHLTECHTLGNS